MVITLDATDHAPEVALEPWLGDRRYRREATVILPVAERVFAIAVLRNRRIIV
jgi:hypothetical protein